MSIFRYAFDLKGAPQMAYFIRVGGVAAIKKLEEQNAELGIVEEVEDVSANAMDIDAFEKLSIDDKLVMIYKLIINRSIK